MSKNYTEVVMPAKISERESLTDAEKLEAGKKLRELVDEILLRFHGDVKEYNGTIIQGEKQLSILLEVPVGGEVVLAAVKSSYREKEGATSAEIHITEQQNGRDSRRYRYHIDPETDYEVLRYDIDDARGYARMAEHTLKRIDFRSDTALTDINFNISALKNALENQRLEKQMGVNDQPVGPEEIDKLRHFLEDARVH